ncbi:hypothetical protein NIES3585_03630 [Nodularia sp. NIES-3585]|nr:hypothetical protein NIES3585_03630 [Nodularia sp. NIES-3585]
MERLYRGFDMITNDVHISNQQRPLFYINAPSPVIGVNTKGTPENKLLYLLGWRLCQS